MRIAVHGTPLSLTWGRINHDRRQAHRAGQAAGYQPSKAELEEPIILRKPDGSAPAVDEVVSDVLSPVKVIEDPDA